MKRCRVSHCYHNYKFCYYGSLLLLLVLISTTTTTMMMTVEAQMGKYAAIRDRWNLPDSPTSFEFDDGAAGGGFKFIFEYPISSQVATDDNIDVRVYDKGCRYNEGDPTVELTKGTSEKVTFQRSSSSTAATVMTTLDVTLGGNVDARDGLDVASLLQKYPTLWNKEESQITFCVRFSLQTENIEVNFLETVVTLDVVLDGIGFKINDAGVAPKEKIESVSRVSYEVKAYLCDGRYQPLGEETTGLVDLLYEACDAENGLQTFTETTETTTTTTGEDYQQELSDGQKAEKENIIYPQGSVVRVCIRPDDTSMGQVSMRTVNQFVFQGTVTPVAAQNIIAVAPTTELSGDGTFTQIAIEEGTTFASSGLSSLSCETNRLNGKPDVVVCAVDTLLVAAFYWRPHGTQATVTAYGIAALRFGDGTNNDGNPTRRQRQRHLKSMAIHDQQPQQQQQQQRKTAVTLDTFWKMTRPIVDFSGIEDTGGGFDFNLEYTVSDGIANDMIQLEIWNKECSQIGEEPLIKFTAASQSTSSDLLEISSTDAYETGAGDGTQTIRVNGRWKREDSNFAPTLVKSSFYTEVTDGSLVQVSLCVRYQLHTKADSGGFEVNFLETPVIINIDFKAGIEFGVGFSLIGNDDVCLQELQQMSAGGLDDLYANGLLWSPGAYPNDSSSPMGASSFGGGSSQSPYGSSTGGSNSDAWSNTMSGYQNKYRSQSSSANNNVNHQIGSSYWTAKMIGTMVFLVLSLI